MTSFSSSAIISAKYICYVSAPLAFCRYCQGTGMMAASLLLLMEEEDAFWMMSTIVEDLLPASYYSSTLIGTFLHIKSPYVNF